MRSLILIVFALLSFGVFAQVPEAINYQAVARDADGVAMPNKQIGLRFSILMGGPNGPAVYEETHQVVTNILGLFNVQIGRGVPSFGSLAGVNWGSGSYFVAIEIDPNGGNNYQVMGAYEMVSVPYALYAKTAGNVGADLDEQTLSISNDTLYISNGNYIVLPADGPDLDEQGLVLSNDTLYITNGNGAIALSDYVDDADADPTNELQQLTLVNDSIILSINGSGVDVSSFMDNTDSQQLSISNDTLYLTGGGFAVIPQSVDTDEQDLILSNDTLYITNGNGAVYLGDYIDDADADSTNELQDIFVQNDTIFISDGNGFVYLGDYVNDADSDTTNEIQGLSVSNDSLYISGSPIAIDLSPYLDNTDNQQLSISNDTIYLANGGFVTIPQSINTDEQDLILSGDTLYISNGNGFVDLSSYIDDADSDPNNELQDLTLTNDTLFLSNSAAAVDLTGFLDNTDQQTLSVLGNDLSISSGNTVTINPDDADADPQNEIQALQYSNDTLRITNNPLSPAIDLGVYLDDTDNQTLTFDAATGTLGISGGNSISLPFSTGGDNWGTQTAVSTGAISGLGTTASPLTLDQQGATAGMVLKWNGTAWVPSTDLVNDADSDATNELNTGVQLVGTVLQVTDAAGTLSVDLSALQDGVNDADSDPSNELQTLTKAGNQITLSDGGGSVTDEVNDADADPANEIQDLQLTGNILTITNNGTATNIDLSPYLDNTDSQILSISPSGDLTISGGNTVTLPLGSGGDNWGTQTAATDGTTILGDGSSTNPLTLGSTGANSGDVWQWNGTQWVLNTINVDDADADPTNELQDLVFDPVTGDLSLTNSSIMHSVYDNWGTAVVNSDATLSGNGTSASPLTIAQQGAADGDVLQWDAAMSTWLPASGGGGTLDDAYNFGLNPGDGRIIQAIYGSVVVKGNGGLVLHSNAAAGMNDGFLNLSNGNLMYFNPQNGSFRSGNTSTGASFSGVNVGSMSFGSGLDVIASGDRSAAFGNSTTASAANSVAFGDQSDATGQNSISYGRLTTASGQNAISGGNQSTAQGDNSISIGSQSFSYGDNSVAIGEGVYTMVRGMTVVGHWNDLTTVTNVQNGVYSSSLLSNIPVFMVGNGTSAANRSTAMTILNNGNVGIGLLSPAFELDLAGDLNLDSDTNLIYLSGARYIHSQNGTSNFFAGYNSGSLNNSFTQTIGIGTNVLNTLNSGFNIVAIGNGTAGNTGNLSSSVVIGSYALNQASGTISENTIVGANAMEYTTGTGNTAIGYQAGDNGTPMSHSYNTFVGAQTNATASFSNSTALGRGATITASNQIVLGNASVSAVQTGAGTVITTSDRNLKTNIQDSDLGLDFILQLRPVVYEMKTGHEGILYTGFIAQEVEDILERMNADFSGLKRPMSPTDHYGLRYASFTVPLVNAVQEQQEQIEILEQQNALLQQQIDQLLLRIEALENP